MSTYIKGKAFELRTKAIIEKMLCNSELELKVGGESELWVVPKSSQTFHQKSYTYTLGLQQRLISLLKSLRKKIAQLI